MCSCTGRNLRLTEWVQCLLIACRFGRCSLCHGGDVFISCVLNHVLPVYLNAVHCTNFKMEVITFRFKLTLPLLRLLTLFSQSIAKRQHRQDFITHKPNIHHNISAGLKCAAVAIFTPASWWILRLASMWRPLGRLLYVTKWGFNFGLLSAQMACSIFVHVSVWKYVWKNNPPFGPHLVLVSLLDVNSVSQNLKGLHDIRFRGVASKTYFILRKAFREIVVVDTVLFRGTM